MNKKKLLVAAILYYSHERGGWVAQGWYNISPGQCDHILNYEGGMFVYGYTSSSTYSGSGSGFCGKQQGFFGFQKVKCRSDEKFYQGIPIDVPSNGGGFCFTFGDPGLIRDDDSGC